MAIEPSLAIDATFLTSQEAHARLKIQHTNISDGDVVSAFYAAYDVGHDCGDAQQWAIRALEVIAKRRRSPLLTFILTVIPGLTWDNVRLLASKPDAAPGSSTTNEAIERRNTVSIVHKARMSASDLESSNSPDSDPTLTPPSSSDYDMTMDYPDHISLSSSEKTSSTGIGISSDSNDSADAESDFDDHVGGKFWDGHIWRCEECNDELVAGKCPNGDIINPCRYCGLEFEGKCPRVCDDCHIELRDQCSDCTYLGPIKDTSSSDECLKVWDYEDNIWRCKDCSWEIEANDENEGQCHCVIVDSENPRAEAPAYPIELLYYPEYEPADSDSSGLESVDSEPDSEDEAFIEEDGAFDPALLTLSRPLSPPDGSEEIEDITTIDQEDTSAASHESQTMDLT